MKKKVAVITTIAVLSSTFATNALASAYQVQKGDTLSQIARKHSTSVSQLKTLNNLTSDMIYVNQTLKVAAAPNSVGTVVTPSPVSPSKPAVTPSAPSVSTYTVVKGDTLSKIAGQHKISLTDLMKWNNLDHHIIYPDQVLKVTATSSSTPTNGQDNNNAQQPTKPVNQSEYTVQKGDTLGQISVKVGTTVAELKKLNNLSSDLIYVGQKLKISGSSIPEKDTPITEAPSNSSSLALIDQAKKLLGTPYAWGGGTLSGFDCSGFIHYVFNAVGTKINRLSTEGYYSRSYYVDSPKVGDLVFFENTYKQGISHMGIYLGNNEFIHASSSKGVIISSLNEAYYKKHFEGFKKFY